MNGEPGLAGGTVDPADPRRGLGRTLRAGVGDLHLHAGLKAQETQTESKDLQTHSGSPRGQQGPSWMQVPQLADAFLEGERTGRHRINHRWRKTNEERGEAACGAGSWGEDSSHPLRGAGMRAGTTEEQAGTLRAQAA